jgi:nicotinamide-nucleotide amidase
VGIYAKPDGIHLRIIARASTQAEARALILPVEKAIRDRLDRYIWGFDSETSQSVACSLLKEHNLSLATMESCTGGLLANTLTLCNESAGVYKGGFITPTTESLINSGIPSSLIEAKGAVSPEVAEAMANVARYRFQAHVGVGITGVAEPDERQGRDQGVVHTAIAFNARMALFRTHLPPRRALIRERAVSGALVELVRLLKVI